MAALPHSNAQPSATLAASITGRNSNISHHHVPDNNSANLPPVGVAGNANTLPTTNADPHVKWHGLLYKYKFTVMKAWWRPCVAALMDDGEFAWHKCSSEDEARSMLNQPYRHHHHSSTSATDTSQNHRQTTNNNNVPETSSRTSQSPAYEKIIQLLDLPYGGAVFGETIAKLPPFLTPPMRHLNKTPLTQMFGFHTQQHQVGSVNSATSSSSASNTGASSSQDRLFHHHNDKTYWFCSLNKDDYEHLRNALGVVLLGNAETFHYPLPVDLIRDIWTGAKEPRQFRVVLQDVKQKRLEAAHHDAVVEGHGDEEQLRRQQAHPNNNNVGETAMRQSVMHNALHHPPALQMQQE